MILPQSDSFTLLKNRLKCVFYFNSMQKMGKGLKEEITDEFEKNLEKIYEGGH